MIFEFNAGLPHIQGNLGNFQVIENLRETQGSFNIKTSQENFFLDIERNLVNPVSTFDQKDSLIDF